MLEGTFCRLLPFSYQMYKCKQGHIDNAEKMEEDENVPDSDAGNIGNALYLIGHI